MYLQDVNLQQQHYSLYSVLYLVDFLHILLYRDSFMCAMYLQWILSYLFRPIIFTRYFQIHILLMCSTGWLHHKHTHTHTHTHKHTHTQNTHGHAHIYTQILGYIFLYLSHSLTCTQTHILEHIFLDSSRTHTHTHTQNTHGHAHTYTQILAYIYLNSSLHTHIQAKI